MDDPFCADNAVSASYIALTVLVHSVVASLQLSSSHLPCTLVWSIDWMGPFSGLTPSVLLKVYAADRIAEL